MGLLSRIDETMRLHAEARTPGNINDFWYNTVPMTSDAGIPINTRSAMSISAFWKCVRWRAQMFGMFGKKLMEVTEEKGRRVSKPAYNHPLYDVVNRFPNPVQTSMEFWEMYSADLDREGNWYAYIQRDAFGKAKYLWRIRPDRVRVVAVTGFDGAYEKQFFVCDDYGKETQFFADEIIHVPGLGYDGLRGYSPIEIHMNALGYIRATTRFGAQFFKNAGRPSAIISTPTAIKDAEVKRGLIDSLTASGKAAGTVVLIEGSLDYKPMAFQQDEAQFIETMQWQEEDMAGIMNVKPHKIGIMRHMTNNNVEQQNIEAVTDCLQPICARFEQALDLALLSSAPSTGKGGGTERDRFHFYVELKTLLRGDMAAQTAHIKDMFDRTIYSTDDAREFLGLSPLDEGGERRWINSAYVPIDKIDAIINNRQRPEKGPAMDSPLNAAVPVVDDGRMKARSAFQALFADATGRLLNRKKDREKYAAEIFSPVIAGLWAFLAEGTLEKEFIDRYIVALTERIAAFTGGRDELAGLELERAINAMIERRDRE